MFSKAQGVMSEQLPNIHKTFLMRSVEEMFGGRDIRLVMVDLYNRLGSQRAVARRLGISQPTIVSWFQALGIVIRPRHEATLADPFTPTDLGVNRSSKA